jgi:uncharacterized membrane protein YgcG
VEASASAAVAAVVDSAGLVEAAREAEAPPEAGSDPMRFGLKRRSLAHLLSPAEKHQLRELIERLERDTTAEMSVMLLHDTADPARFAREYFDHHGIGKKDQNNGVFVLVVVAKRHIEITVGAGLKDAVPQAFLEQVISETMAASFREKQYGEGLMRGVEAIGQRLRAERPELRPGEPTKIPPIVDLDQGT